MPINRKKKQRNKNKAEQDLRTVHELPYTEIVKSGSPVVSGFCDDMRLNRFFLLVSFKIKGTLTAAGLVRYF